MPHDPTGLPVIVSAQQAIAAGLTKDQIRHRVRAGTWIRLARGQYSRSSGPHDARALHIQRAVANALNHPDATIGSESAVLLRGLPLNGVIPDVVTLCVPAGQWTGRRAGVNFRLIHPAMAADRQWLAPFDGVLPVPVVSGAHAWLQIASIGSLSDALVVGDAGLRRGEFSVDELRAAAHALAFLRGRSIIMQAVDEIDARRESPLESQTWAYFIRHGVPLPELQVEIRDEWGQFIARVDLLWREEGIVGEIDGRSKYSDSRDLYSEKRREDEIRGLGYGFVRMGREDLRSAALAVKLARLLIEARAQNRQRPRLVRGSAVGVKLVG